MGLCADSATLHVMQLARQALPMGLKHAEANKTIDDPPAIPSLMIRNVPTLYTPEELRTDLKMLGMYGGRDFDFLYLPLNAKKRRRNRGYAFLNVRTTRATALILQLHNTYLPKHGPPLRPLGICASDVQGFEANWRHFAHVFLDSSFTRSRPSEGPLFWKDGKELEARSDDIARIKKEANPVYGPAASAVVSLRFCVMCGEPRRSNGRYCAECGYDLLDYCSKGAFTGALDPHFDGVPMKASTTSNTPNHTHNPQPKNTYANTHQHHTFNPHAQPHTQGYGRSHPMAPVASAGAQALQETTSMLYSTLDGAQGCQGNGNINPLSRMMTTKPNTSSSFSYPYSRNMNASSSSQAWKPEDVHMYGLAVEQQQMDVVRRKQQDAEAEAQAEAEAERIRARQAQFRQEVRQQLQVREEEEAAAAAAARLKEEAVEKKEEEEEEELSKEGHKSLESRDKKEKEEEARDVATKNGGDHEVCSHEQDGRNKKRDDAHVPADDDNVDDDEYVVVEKQGLPTMGLVLCDRGRKSSCDGDMTKCQGSDLRPENERHFRDLEGICQGGHEGDGEGSMRGEAADRKTSMDCMDGASVESSSCVLGPTSKKKSTVTASTYDFEDKEVFSIDKKCSEVSIGCKEMVKQSSTCLQLQHGCCMPESEEDRSNPI